MPLLWERIPNGVNPINQSLVILDEQDRDLLPISVDAYGYGQIGTRKYGTRKVHRVIAERMGLNISGKQVDHKDGNRLNNSRSNLRVATNQQNSRNSAAKSKGYKGVSFCKRHGKWRAYIKVDYKYKSLGYHKTAELAAEAYNSAAKKHFGNFAKLNLIGESND